MAISTSLLKLADYYSRNGFGATFRRTSLAVRRTLFSNGMVLLYCDLSDVVARTAAAADFVKVEQKKSRAELSQEDLQVMISFWNSKLAYRNIQERFKKGAVLWLLKSVGGLAGYGWTLQGRTIEPHYFPLGHRDLHLFDFHVFPQYRGRGMNTFLVGQILRRAAADGGARAFIEAAAWNEAQLASLKKTPFQRFGRARKWPIFGHTFVWWLRDKTFRQEACPVASDNLGPPDHEEARY